MDYDDVISNFNKSNYIFSLDTDDFLKTIHNVLSDKTDIDNLKFFQDTHTNLIFVYRKQTNTFALSVNFPLLWNPLNIEKSLRFYEGLMTKEKLMMEPPQKISLLKAHV